MVADRLGAAGGAFSQLRIDAAGAATFRALPWPSVSVMNLRLDGAGGAIAVSAPEARMELSLVELLRGRLAPIRARFVSAIATLDLDRPPVGGRAGWLNVTQAVGAFAPLDGVSVTDGVLRVRSGERGLDLVIESLNGSLGGLAERRRMRMDLSATWRDAPLAVSGLLADPELAVREKPTPVSLAVVSRLATLSFKGALAQGAVPGLAGDLAVSAPSLRELAQLIGVRPPPIFPGDDVAIAGRISASPNEATLADATVASAGQTLQGALHVTRAGARPMLSGTLDADRLSLAPLIGLAEPPLDARGAWSNRALALAPPKDFDLDLRLSAGRLNTYGHELVNAAVSLILKDRVLTATLIDAAAYGGRLKAEARIACIGSSLDLQARGSVSDVDFGAAFSDFGWPAISGKGAAEFALESIGDSPAALVAGLGGSASLRLEQGVLADVNLEEMLRRSQRRRIDVARDMRAGGTAFDRLKLELAVNSGVAQVENGEFAAQGVAGALEGQIDLARRTLGLRFSAMQTGSSGEESQDAAHLTLDVGGPWSEPTIRVSGDKAEDPGAAPGATLSP